MINKSTSADIDIIMQLIDDGRKKMIADGNTHQWANGHPSREQIIDDIIQGNSYLIIEDGEIVATFVLMEGPDPTYSQIYEGAWLNDHPYYVIHRVASSPKAHGVMRIILAFAFEKTDTIRIDTHEDNATMRNLLKKYGFTYCGIILLANGDPRLAYQKTITP